MRNAAIEAGAFSGLCRALPGDPLPRGYCTNALPVTCGIVTVFVRSADVTLTV